MASISAFIVASERGRTHELAATLVRLGYRVAGSAAPSQATLGQIAAAAPDVVLLEIGDREQASHTATQIAEQCNLPVVCIRGSRATPTQPGSSQPQAYLIKPFSAADLRAAIDLALHHTSIEHTVKQVERWLTATLRSIGDAVITTDTRGRVTLINPIAEQLTGWSQPEALGRPIEEIFQIRRAGADQPLPSPVMRALREGTIVTLEPQTLLVTKSGATLAIDDSAAPIRDDQNDIAGAVLVFRDVSERERAQERLEYMAWHDQLTGAANRTVFTERLEHAFLRAQRHPEAGVAVLLLDLDRFKAVNDSLGHLVGDQLLISVTRRLESCLRSIDTLARLGGDEFAILLEDVTSADDAVRIASRIHELLAASFTIDGHELYLAVSIGIVLLESTHQAPIELLRDADNALYKAKAQGRSCSVVFDAAMHRHAVERLQLELDLRQALERQELEVFYQPIIALSSRQVHGFEALVRWRHPQRGYLPPDLFLPIAEEMGLIMAIDWWVMRQACQQLRAWLGQLPADQPPTISVNLSHRHFDQPHFDQRVAALLAETGVAGRQLQLEISEQVLIHPSDSLEETLAALRALDVQLHLNDFGTGHSSLTALYLFPVTAVKIDRSFIKNIGQPGRAYDLVAAIEALAKRFGLATIVEGIESGAQLELLAELGCTYAQGHCFAPPADAATTSAWLASWAGRPITCQ